MLENDAAEGEYAKMTRSHSNLLSTSPKIQPRWSGRRRSAQPAQKTRRRTFSTSARKCGFVRPWFVMFLLSLMFCDSMASLLTETLESKCIPLEAMDVTMRIKRYVVDSKEQVTLPLTIADSDRVSHRLTNAIFKTFLQEVVGYQEVTLVHHDDLMSPEPVNSFFINPIKFKRPKTLVNLEVWTPPGYSDPWGRNMKDRGSQGTGGRFGWYVLRGSSNDLPYILDHWRSYQNETVAQAFALTEDEVVQVKTLFAKDNEGTHYCTEDICEDGIFVPDICKGKKCATLFADHYKYSSFLVKQIIDQRLLVQVAWIGPNLTPQFIQRFREEKPIIFFSWWPSPNSVLQNLLRVAFPSCTEVDLKNSNSYLCKYEMHALRKQSWRGLEAFAKFAFDTIERFSLHEEDYQEILLEYNRLTSLNLSQSLIQPTRKPDWDDDIIEHIACNWLNKTAANDTLRLKSWRPYKFNKKPVLWIGSIFPYSESDGRYSSKTLVHAAQMAIQDVNSNSTILNDYNLELNSVDGACAIDFVLYAFIRYIRAPSLNFNQLIGILGPSCSDTVEPLLGIAKLFNTVITSYSAEGAIVYDQGKYPYFFRTIPENILYSDVYVQLFKELKWKRLASLTQDGSKYSEYINLLPQKLEAVNSTIYNKKFLKNARKDMTSDLKYLKDENYHIIIGDSYSGMACEIMCEAYRLRMTARHGFIWFLPRWFSSKWYLKCNTTQNSKCNVEEVLLALDGHLSLGHAYYAPDRFVYHSGNTVADWKDRYMQKHSNTTPADYAGYTYDAVWTYAFALDKLLKEKFTHAANMHSNRTNDRFVELLRRTDFLGVSGHISFQNGTSRRTIVNIMQFRSNLSSQEGTYNIVGHFYPADSMPGGGTISLSSSSIEWLTPDGEQPTDGSLPPAVCALDAFSKLLGMNCEFTIVITMLISFAVFACFVIACFCVYKKKYEKMDKLQSKLRTLLNLDEWEVPRDNVVINRTIGEGVFGTVYGGQCKINEDSSWAGVAVKTLKEGSTAENKLEFLGEAEMMKQFDHKNIVKLIGLCTRVEPIYMIMEFMLLGDLGIYLLSRRHLVSDRTLYNDGDEISNRRLTSMALDVACALEYLASKKYVHRDVASRNCLVNEDRVVKLSDFGMTRHVYESNYYRFSRKGLLPVRWMAPESIEDGIYTSMTDVWSYGVLLYEIITFGNYPFQGLSNIEVCQHVKDGNTIQVPDGVTPQLKHILDRCWRRVPEERPTFTELKTLFGNFPRLITPCLEVPLMSVQTNDSDILEMGIDPTRRVCAPRSQIKLAQIQHQQQLMKQQKLQKQPQKLHNPAEEMERVYDTQPSIRAAVFCGNQAASCSRLRRNRTPVENGNGPISEPLLPFSVDDIATRYACLQMNNKSPVSEGEPSQGTENNAGTKPNDGMTAV